MSYTVEKQALHLPPLQEISKVISEGLQRNFANVTVEVVECPDLTQTGWGLATPGLCGTAKLGEVGGVPYLMPLYNKDKYYRLEDTLKATGLSEGLIIGAGAGPFRYLGTNSEMMVNAKIGSSVSNHSKAVTVNNETVCVTDLPQCAACFGILLNFFVCEGKPGPVIKVKASKRTGQQDFVGCMREALASYYGDKPVGFGGTFRVNKGSVKVHVMPDFSTTPLSTDEEMSNWLTYCDVPAPSVFMSVVISKDPGMEVRLEHSHGMGSQSGGHYHYDVTPEQIEYEGYFNLAEELVRVDRPKTT